MPTTLIKTGECRKTRVAGSGEVAEVLNRDLCGAQNVLGMLRWLGAGDSLAAGPSPDAHHLVYLMEGAGVITLDKKDYEVGSGAGVYLGPTESATIRQAGKAPLKLFHLVVPRLRG